MESKLIDNMRGISTKHPHSAIQSRAYQFDKKVLLLYEGHGVSPDCHLNLRIMAKVLKKK
jgi:hypothetical protein